MEGWIYFILQVNWELLQKSPQVEYTVRYSTTFHRDTRNKVVLGSKFEAFTMPLDSYYMLEMHYRFPVNGKYMPALVAQGLERSIADRQVPRSNRGQSSFFLPATHPSVHLHLPGSVTATATPSST